MIGQETAGIGEFRMPVALTVVLRTSNNLDSLPAALFLNRVLKYKCEADESVNRVRSWIAKDVISSPGIQQYRATGLRLAGLDSVERRVRVSMDIADMVPEQFDTVVWWAWPEGPRLPVTLFADITGMIPRPVA